MSKTKIMSEEQIKNYFQGAPTFSMKEKLYWYKSLLDALVLANEEEKSKDGKRFRYDFERHKIVIANIESLHAQGFVQLAGVSRDYSHGIMPILKTHCEQLRETVQGLLEKLFEEYVNNKEIFSQENNLNDNPIVGHGEILQGVGAIKCERRSEFAVALENAHKAAAERLYAAISTIDRELSDGTVNPIRAAWLNQLLIHNSNATIYVYGSWRVNRMIDLLMHKDFRFVAQKLEQPTDEKDQKMLAEIQATFGKPHSEQVVGDEPNESCVDHGCECCHEHEHQI